MCFDRSDFVLKPVRRPVPLPHVPASLSCQSSRCRHHSVYTAACALATQLPLDLPGHARRRTHKPPSTFRFRVTSHRCSRTCEHCLCLRCTTMAGLGAAAGRVVHRALSSTTIRTRYFRVANCSRAPPDIGTCTSRFAPQLTRDQNLDAVGVRTVAE